MNVIGVNYGSSDAGICVIVDDREPIAIALERLDRIKYSGEITEGWRSHYEANFNAMLQYCADGLGMDRSDLRFDVVAHTKQSTEDDEFRGLLAPYVSSDTTFVQVNHHLAHAAGAYFPSGFDDAAVLVVDGSGDRPVDHVYANGMSEKQSTYRATGNAISTIHKTYGTPAIPCGLGFAYDIVTYHLRFGWIGEAGKTMGLASYGTGELFDGLEVFHRYADGDILMRPEFFHWPDWATWDGLEAGWETIRGTPSAFGRVRTATEALPAPVWNEMAYRIQKELERAMVELATHLHQVTRSPNLCMSGGVALNCIANREVLDKTPFERVFIQPAASDTGLALGAALYGRHVVGGEQERWTMTTAYLGREYSRAEVQAALAEVPGIVVEACGDDGAGGAQVERCVAELLADNRIVGWFQGRSEYGPRALGNRSILMDPRRAENKDVLNERVKRREGFRPFAPAVLCEHAEDYFDLGGPSPFMLLAARVHEHRAAEIPAVVHVDGTARVQTVSRDDNGRFYDLISAFHDLTGTPVLLNTSFNLAGEPIVETPQDAVRTFLATEMDHLVLHDLIVTKVTG